MHFGAFKATPELSSLRFVNGSEFIPSGDARSTYSEHFHSEVGDVALTWEPLADVFMAKLPKEKSSLGLSPLYSAPAGDLNPFRRPGGKKSKIFCCRVFILAVVENCYT